MDGRRQPELTPGSRQGGGESGWERYGGGSGEWEVRRDVGQGWSGGGAGETLVVEDEYFYAYASF